MKLVNFMGGVIGMRERMFNTTLTDEEQKFATEHHSIVTKYLGIRKLPVDDWYDVVIFRYLLSVKRWFAIPELHQYKFETIACNAMRSAIGNEYKKQSRRISAISLDDVIPGTENLTLMDIIADPHDPFEALFCN